jgi:TonB-linked SusC/RagA family outer membrane protein
MKNVSKRFFFTREKKLNTKARAMLMALSVFLCLSLISAGTLSLQAQGRPVTGTVTDNAGNPLPGVAIMVKGTTTGAITDLQGRFQLSLTEDTRFLVFSFVGMKTQEVAVDDKSVFYIIMEEESIEMEELVIIGYGVQKKESVVAAISSTTGDVVRQSTQGSDLATSLTGNIPGLITITTSGIPGGEGGKDNDYAEILIRGQKTWNESGPLVLVDGVERPLNNVNPYEVEMISVLKDASATAVFGVKGANGVILITTLRGQEGKPQLSFDANMTGKTVSRVANRLGSYNANLLKNYAILNEYPVNPVSWNSVIPNRWLEAYKTQEFPYYLPDVDWSDEMIRDMAFEKNVNLTLRGGTSFVKYFGSIGYLNEGDVFNISDRGQGYDPSFSYDRLNFRSNLDFEITKTTRFSTSLSGYHGIRSQPHPGSIYENSGYMGFYNLPPDIYPVKYDDGIYADNSGFSRYYPSPLLAFSFYGNSVNKTTQVNTDFTLNQKLDFITQGLSANARLSFDNRANSTGPRAFDDGVLTKWISPFIMDDIYPGMSAQDIKDLEAKYTIYEFPGSAQTDGYDWSDIPVSYGSESAGTNVFRSLFYQASLNYGRDFNKHSVGGLFLVSRQERTTGSNFPGFREDWVGRATYSYDRKYLFEVNGAYNGSEKFDRAYRFGFFPSVALGWVISNEAFFEPVKPVVNNLKLRYSDGKVGSDAGLARWQYTKSWNVLNSSWGFGETNRQAAYPIRTEGIIPNPNAQWEEARKRDFGLELGLFNNQITFIYDYFIENRSKIFIPGADIRNVPDYFGSAPGSANIGKVDVKGWEIEMMAKKTTARGLSLWISHAWAFSKDIIIEAGDPELAPAYQKLARYQINQPTSQLNQSLAPMQSWNEMFTGVMPNSNTTSLPGDFRKIDFNADGVIDGNDRVPYGFPARPQYSYAPAIGMSYKGFSGNVRFYGVYNVSGESGLYKTAFEEGYSIVFPWQMENAWNPELGLTDNARLGGLRFLTPGNPGSFGDGGVENSRSFLRLQSAELGYAISSQRLKKMGISNLRLKLSGTNLFLWSDMTEDMDAMANPDGVGTRNSYPRFKRYNFGISFNFQ